MVNKMRLPMIIAVVVIVALLLPGPLALAVTPDPPRLTGANSFVSGTPGAKLNYGAKSDAKTGMVTFVGRSYNTSSNINWGKVSLAVKVPNGTNLIESWCSQPGTYPGDYDPNTGWVRWSVVKRAAGVSETSTHLCGITVGGWDGKAILDSGWEADWAGAIISSSPASLGWKDGTNNRNNILTASFRYPFDTEIVSGSPVRGFYRVLTKDTDNAGGDNVYVPSSATFRALEARVKALESKAGMAAFIEEEE
jgi:hypothetical protein